MVQRYCLTRPAPIRDSPVPAPRKLEDMGRDQTTEILGQTEEILEQIIELTNEIVDSAGETRQETPQEKNIESKEEGEEGEATESPEDVTTQQYRQPGHIGLLLNI